MSQSYLAIRLWTRYGHPAPSQEFCRHVHVFFERLFSMVTNKTSLGLYQYSELSTLPRLNFYNHGVKSTKYSDKYLSI